MSAPGQFVVGLSAGFLRPDASAAFPDFDLGELERDPGIVMRRLTRSGRIAAEDTAGLDALILLGEAFDADSIAGDARLKLVARFGVGFDKVDTAACTNAGIAVSITPDGVRRPVAVAIITLLLALAGRLKQKDHLARQGAPGFAQRAAAMGVGLENRVLASIGLGNIACEMFRLAAPFGMRMAAHDPFADPDLARSLGVELLPLETLFERADFLAVNCPLTPQTQGLVGRSLLWRMKPTAFLVNTARGPIVDQPALVAALRERRIAGAALDVYTPEPLDPADPLVALDNVLLTPHCLSWTDQCFAAIGRSCVASVRAVRESRAPQHLANPQLLARTPRARLFG